MDRTTGSCKFAVAEETGLPGQLSSLRTGLLRLRQFWLLEVLLLSGAFLIPPLAVRSAQAQRKLIAIEQDLRPASPREVVCVRRRERPPIVLPMDLEIGDKLISERRQLSAKIKCGKATLTAWAPFRLQFKDNPQKTCYMGYSSTKTGGRLLVEASGPTGVLGPGAARMESANTLYEIRINKVGRRAERQWLVYEGKVTVRTRRRVVTTVKEGEKLVTTKAGAAATQRITRADIELAAQLYARVDVSQLPVNVGKGMREAAFVRLQTLHEAVLANPKNQEPQRQLVNEQQRLGIPVEAANEVPESNPRTHRVDFTLNSNAKTTKPIPVFACKKSHRFQIRLGNLPFARLVSPAEDTVAAGQDTRFLVEFDTTGIKPGNYQGEIFADCLDCVDDCVENWIGRLIVNLTISGEKQDELKLTILEKEPATKQETSEKSPQAAEQQTAIIPPSKTKTVSEKSEGLPAEIVGSPEEKAITEPEARKNEQPVGDVKTKTREKSKDQLRSSTLKKQAESSGKTIKKTPYDLKSWDLELLRDTKPVHTFKVVNPCGKDRTVTIIIKDLPFVRLLSKAEITIKAGETIGVRIEFDPSKMKPGNYQGSIGLTCPDCLKQHADCNAESRPRSLNVSPVDLLFLNVNIK